MAQFKYEEITKKIIGAAMKVHSTLGNGYLEAYNLEVGLLLNFGNISLEFKRLENPKYKTLQRPENPL